MPLVDVGMGNPEPHFLSHILSPSQETSGHIWEFQIQTEHHTFR